MSRTGGSAAFRPIGDTWTAILNGRPRPIGVCVSGKLAVVSLGVERVASGPLPTMASRWLVLLL